MGLNRVLLCVVVVVFLCGGEGCTIYPEKINAIKVKDISTAGYATVVLTNDLEVHWWGLGSSPDPSVPQSQKLEFENHKIVSIDCGGFHCLALTETGLVYEWGFTKGMSSDFVGAPKLISELTGHKIVQISAGYQHNIVVTDKGQVFSWGESLRGKLGHDIVGNDHIPPNPVPLPESLFITNACAGGDHSMLLDDKGRVYSFGANTDGQLGLGHEKDQSSPKLILHISDIKIEKISCGGDHNLVLSDSGEAYSWGWGEYGQLGHGDSQKRIIPEKINVPFRVKKIAATSYGHSLLLSDDGDVYSMGLGDTCQD